MTSLSTHSQGSTVIWTGPFGRIAISKHGSHTFKSNGCSLTRLWSAFDRSVSFEDALVFIARGELPDHVAKAIPGRLARFQIGTPDGGLMDVSTIVDGGAR